MDIRLSTTNDYRYTIQAVCEWYGLKFYDIQRHDRKRTVTTARFLAIMLCRELHGMSIMELADIFNRDPGSIKNALEVGHSKAHIQRLFRYLTETLRLKYRR